MISYDHINNLSAPCITFDGTSYRNSQNEHESGLIFFQSCICMARLLQCIHVFFRHDQSFTFILFTEEMGA